MKIKYAIFLASLLVFINGCGKAFLDKKRDIKQVIPAHVADYQALLDKYAVINGGAAVSLGLVGAGEYILPGSKIEQWKSMIPYEAYGYYWADEVFDGKESTDWNNAYHRILYANMALEVQKLKPSAAEQADWNNVKGSALFVRAFSFYQLAQLFCKPYDAATAQRDLGVPLKLSYDVTEKLSRGTVADVYQQIIADLEEALDLVPAKQKIIYRPNKAAVAVLLSRVYLQMQNYENVAQYAAMGLEYQSELLDFNTLTFTGLTTFPSDNGLSMPEVIFYSFINKPSTTFADFNPDPALYALYEEHDLRRRAYFGEDTQKNLAFKGSIAGYTNIFTGFTTSELWLMHAEAQARLGNTDKAIEALNHLRQYRYEDGFYTPISADNAQQALVMVLEERRKELYFRGIRWEDLRRLNKENAFATTLVRDISGQRYELAPGSNKWVWPLPFNEIDLNGYEQNPR